MKFNTRLLLLFILGIAAVAKATDPTRSERCGTMGHLNNLQSLNPALAQEMKIDEQNLQTLIANSANARLSNTIYTIPVVVHVIYKTSGQNISDAQVLSQIDVLNEDFGRTNPDTFKTPAPWKSLAKPTNFQFCLARTDPSGNSTTGIERRQTTVSAFTDNDAMKVYSTGGMDAWDVNRYLNIWVCNMSGGLLGYAEFPASNHTNTYGVVIQFNAFGRVGTVSQPYNLGRTCTHEISHCFRLYHIWGDDGGLCSSSPGGGSDNVNDTPDQSDATWGCLTFPAFDNCATAATPPGYGFMFMNYMDYTDDTCVNMFTTGQVVRMSNALNSYYPTLLNSTACALPTAIKDATKDVQFNVYPNPTKGIVNLDMFLTQNIGDKINVRVLNILGKEIMEKVIVHPNGHVHQLDLSGHQAGIYFVNIVGDNFEKTVRIILSN